MFQQDIARDAPLIASLPNSVLLAQSGSSATVSHFEAPSVECAAALQFLMPAKVGNRQTRMRKLFQCEGGSFTEKVGYDRNARWFQPLPPVTVTSSTQLLRTLKEHSAIGAVFILGELNTNDPRVVELAKTGLVTRTKREKLKPDGSLQLPVWREVPRRVFMIDLDGSPEAHAELRRQGVDLFRDRDEAARRTIDLLFPPDIAAASLAYHYSAKAGLDAAGKIDGAAIKLHAFCILETALLPADFKSLIDHHNGMLFAMGLGRRNLDLALYQAVQPHFIASPEFLGGHDPIEERWGILPGKYEFARLAVGLEKSLGAVDLGRGEKTQRRIVGRHADVSLEKPAWQWPKTVEESLAWMSRKGIHHNALMATYLAAKRLFDTHVISAGTPQHAIEEALAPYVAQIEAAIRQHRTDLAPAEMETEIGRLMEYALGAVPRIFSQLFSRVGAPSHPDTTVSLVEAVPLIEASISAFNKNAIEVHAARQRAFTASTAEPPGTTSLVAPIRSAKAPHALLATEVGSGKTTIALRRIIQDFDLTAARVYFSVPTHELAEQLAQSFADILKGLASEGHDVSSVPPVRIFRGMDRLCKAPPAYRAAAKRAAAEGVCVKSAVCKVCPAKGTGAESGCKWYWQDDISAGLKIVVTASLGSNSTPGFPRTQKERDSQRDRNVPPIVAVFIDEGFGNTLEEKQSISLSSLLTTTDVSALLSASGQSSAGGSPYGGPRGLLNDAMSWVGGAVRDANVHGELALSAFRKAHASGRLDSCRELIARLLFKNEDAAAEEIRTALTAEGEVECDTVNFAARRKLRFLYELLTLVRLTPTGRQFLQCANVQGADKDRRLTLHFRRPLPAWLAEHPLMILDATADENSMPPFGVRDDGNCSEAVIKVTRIKVRAENSFRLKIVNAPEAATKIVEPIRRAARRRGKKKTLRNKPERHRLRRDAYVEGHARFVSAISGRAKNGGLITKKGMVEYLRKQKALPANVASNWFGNIRGLRTFENVDVLTTIGRQLPPLPACEAGAAAMYAFDLENRAIERGKSFGRATQYARLRRDGGDIGVAVETLAHPCNQLNAFVRQKLVSEDAQARGRARAIRRTSDNPVLEISINNIVDGTPYDAILDWSLLATLDERAAALHAYGVVPLAASELFKLAPHLFSSQSQCRQGVKKAAHMAPAPLLPAGARGPISSKAWNHPLLTPAEPGLAVVVMRYRNRTTKKSRVWLDARRPEAGAAALAAALGLKLERWQWLEPAATQSPRAA